MQTYSITRLNLAQECEYKYDLRYLKKEKASVEMSFFIVGQIVHRIIEDFYLSTVQHYPSDIQREWLKGKLDNEFTRKFGADTFAVFKTVSEAKNKALLETSDETGSVSRPHTTAYWRDNFQTAFEKQIEMVNNLAKISNPKIIFFAGYDALYNQAEKCLNNFLDLVETYEIPPSSYVLHEVRLDPAIDIGGFLCGGRIDRLDGFINERGIQSFAISDYKTGKSYWKEEDVKNNPQLIIYSMAWEQAFGTKPKEIRVVDLLHKKVVSVKLEEDDYSGFTEQLTKKLEHASQLEKTLLEGFSEHKTPVTEGMSYRCKSCEFYYDPENKCKYWRI